MTSLYFIIAFISLPFIFMRVYKYFIEEAKKETTSPYKTSEGENLMSSAGLATIFSLLWPISLPILITYLLIKNN
jgi:hypothetical protein